MTDATTEQTTDTKPAPTADEIAQDAIKQFVTAGREESDPEGVPDAPVTAKKETEDPEKETAKSDAAEEPGDEDTEKKPTVQQRINELTREKREAQRRAADLEARLAKLENAVKPADTAATTEDKEPDPSDQTKYPYGELDKTYLRDQAKFEARQEFKRLKAEDEKQQKAAAATQQQTEMQAKIQEMVKRGDSKYEDFQEAINDAAAQGAQLSPELALLIADSDVGEDVVYHLAKHPAEAKKIAAMAPLSMAKEFGKLETRFAKTETTEKKTTKAPAPVAQARGTSGRFSVDASTTNFADFEAKVMAEQARRAS